MEIGWSSSNRPLSTGQGLKSENSARATRGYQKLQVLSRFHAKGSRSRKLRVHEVFAKLPQVVAHASRGRNCKTRENTNFLKNGKMVISVKIRNFSRSRVTK